MPFRLGSLLSGPYWSISFLLLRFERLLAALPDELGVPEVLTLFMRPVKGLVILWVRAHVGHL